MQKKKAIMLVALSVLGNCLGNLSTDIIRGSIGVASKVLVCMQKQSNAHRNSLRPPFTHELALSTDNSFGQAQ